ncbi:hypothetical protein CHGG_05206 [Chaetomium globosum CBS 148.51]|uniref:FAD-binding domain-containing protein n=1 Tax=Chaetomium globosum (strain ATCC 6205 / CBS 148.51 / DSM 1962 / NBRC 6347 / NRRL 1970) TaxID=306901 RepID=Q2GZ40_CHAGB|nr:uncharacterized protein CHGG_05206 [Chaetomium globosum CBS 148.51]EAQ88587.1 hypothetical protein CHGG_05206 [Chaetomium globosum CBS 148.51]
MPPAVSDDPLHVAIIGGGITGVNLALGLQARNVSYTIYERSTGFREIGAGIGFSPNAERAMAALNPDILATFKRLANPNGEDYFRWVDGYETNDLIFQLHVGKDGFQGGLRSTFLEEWSKLIPPTAVHFGKQLDSITEPTAPDSSKLRLHFNDGTTATTDVVIGCDGLHSRVRQLLLSPPLTSPPQPNQPPSPDDPIPATTDNLTYTHKFCFRALAPMPAAIAALGETKATTRFMYNGPGAHLITYPVGNNTLLNILAVISDPLPNSNSTTTSTTANPWPHLRHTTPGHKREAEQAFSRWTATARAIVGLLPDAGMDKWGLFDLAEHPAPYYARGRVCVAGDAAHAAGPHLGAGAGMGVEDALVLAGVLAAVDAMMRGVGGGDGDGDEEGHNGEGGGKEKGEENVEKGNEKVRKRNDGKKGLLERALQVYNEVRYSRTQWVVQATREACDLFQWRDEKVARNPERFGREITQRFHRVWEYDVDGMVEEALAKLRAPAP